MNPLPFSVGDRIIDSEQIHIVTKIDNDMIYYQPATNTKNRQDNNCTCSIPLKNLALACIRPLLTKAEIKELLANLSQNEPLKVPIKTNNQYGSSNFFKEILNQNIPAKTGALLVHLARVQKDLKLSSGDQIIYDQALALLAKEISIVQDITIDAAKAKILASLQ
jgi:RNA polymerase-interacting CarD/CdnL/TRCF family regulator